MHPGVVVSGLGSIFRPTVPPAQNANSPMDTTTGFAANVNRVNTFFSPKPSDPNYNPVYPNDVNLPERSGWANAMHFVSKHSDGLIQAGKTYVTSHVEFGGSMADYSALKKRYARIRALEEEEEAVRKTATAGTATPPRVRFINYYTASTGRPKKPKSPSPSRPSSHSSSRGRQLEAEMQDMHLTPSTTQRSVHSRSSSISPRILVEEHRSNTVVPKDFEEPLSATSELGEEFCMRHIDSIPIDDKLERDDTQSIADLSLVTTQQTTDSSVVSLQDTEVTSPSSTMSLSSITTLPPIPPILDEPPNVDFSQYTDKDTRKLAEKEHARVMKNYKRSIKDRNSALKDRTKLEEKIEKTRRKEFEKAAKVAEKENADRRKKEEQTPELEKEEEFSWENVWAADRARETQQREYERLTREGKHDEAEALLNAGKEPSKKEDKRKPQEAQPQEKPQARNLEAESSSSPPPGSYIHSTSTILNTTAPTTKPNTTKPPKKAHPKDNDPAPKPKRDKKFCMLPPKDDHGRRDPAWFRVYMEGVDEVGAHCGLFFVSETYERLVGDVGARIEEWVREDMTERLVGDLEGGVEV
jgi:hypothetical protein